MAQTLTLGKVSISPKGEYSASASYTFLDTVSNNGGAFLCLQSTTGIEPGVTSGWQTYWMETSVGIANVELSAPAEGQARIIVTLSDGTTSSVDVSTTAIADGSITAAKLATGAIPEALGFNPGMVNPNLLDNWYFVNPVNQRGQISYNTESASGYTIDRWWAIFGLVETGISLKLSSTNATYGANLRQAVSPEKLTGLAGHTVTVTVLVKSGSGALSLIKAVGINSGQVLVGTTPITTGLNTFTVTLPSDIGSTAYPYLNIAISTAVGGSVEVIATKLELGSVQTLARQVNGEWVLNEMLDFGEELAKCQRYFQRFQNRATDTPNPINIGLALGTSTFVLTVPLVTPMRAFPAISIPNISAIKIRDAVGDVIATATAFGSTGGLATNGGYVSRSFYCVVDNTYTLGTAQYFYMDIGGYIDFTADL